MLLKVTLAALLTLAGTAAVRAETAVPDHLIIGYDHEGKIDASRRRASNTSRRSPSGTRPRPRRARKRCAPRATRHVDAYAALQVAYKNFVKTYSVDRRLNLPGAVSAFQVLVKA